MLQGDLSVQQVAGGELDSGRSARLWLGDGIDPWFRSLRISKLSGQHGGIKGFSVAPLASPPVTGNFLIGLAAFVIPFLMLLPITEWEYAELDMSEGDIHQIYVEGGRIAKGENPYERILHNDPNKSDYPTYLPGFYLLGGLARVAGAKDFESWLTLWRAIFLVCHVLIGWLIFLYLWKHNSLTFAVLGSAFWLFNRWTLFVLRIGHLEPLAILLLVASLILLPRRYYTACVLFGCSLAVKQIAIFLLPLYVIYGYRQVHGKRSLKGAFAGLFSITIIPTLISIPFLVDSPAGFIRSLLLSVSRRGEANLGNDLEVPTYDMLLGLEGLPAKVLVFGLMILAYRCLYRRFAPPFTLALLVLFLFADFNSVFFPQYMVWPLAFVPLALTEITLTCGRDGQSGGATLEAR